MVSLAIQTCYSLVTVFKVCYIVKRISGTSEMVQKFDLLYKSVWGASSVKEELNGWTMVWLIYYMTMILHKPINLDKPKPSRSLVTMPSVSTEQILVLVCKKKFTEVECIWFAMSVFVYSCCLLRSLHVLKLASLGIIFDSWVSLSLYLANTLIRIFKVNFPLVNHKPEILPTILILCYGSGQLLGH